MAALRAGFRLSGLYRRLSHSRAAFKPSANPPKTLRHWVLPVSCCSTAAPSSDLSVQYKHGRPVLALPLPSRQETCLFQLRPMLSTVSDLIQDIQREDPGVTASVLTTDGVRIASATSLYTLINKDFQLCINGVVYNIKAAAAETMPSQAMMKEADIKDLVHMIHTALNLPGHHLMKERQLRQKLDILKEELVPLEQMKAHLAIRAEHRSSRALWAGLALLSVQGGALAWLTWWVYSWDIMEPVTYFLTYSTSMSVYAYYVLTKQDYVYPEAKDRQFLHYFYRGAKKQKFNVEKYNTLKDELASVEDDLRRLRNPNQLQLPVEEIRTNSQAALP
ncbi:calcium uniporter protein, mitochondrial-like isoform 2-T2 [Clarias gariepinus]|uniref:calcium uniporter protein, mitochondrial-like isoform X2 n=1 Tax=Clarias gariepinus TaxID=13013 RepID=UPI00234DC66F|nr:calcium uniporter protein, mitochondrial-like isoform X2 [Clarias gariepinus]